MDTVSLLVRLVSDAAADGKLVGHAEVVATGEVVVLRSTDDLVALALRLAGGSSVEADV